MSKQHCPVCGQVARDRKAAKRVEKWAADSRLDRFMFDKLMQLVKARMYGGEKLPDPDPQIAEDPEAADWALNYAEKKNEKLAKNRAYYRDYYHKNKERIDRLRKERNARARSSSRSPTTGAKTNGH